MAHMTKHELKHNEMADLGEKLSNWYENNQKLINAFLIVLLVGIIAYKGYQKWHDSRLASANIQYGTILQNYQNAMNQTDEKQRVELFNTVVTQGERFVDENSRLELAESVQMLLGNAHYYLAASYAADAAQAKPERDKAREAFEKYLTMADTNDEKAVGQLALGNVLENQLFTEKNLELQRDVFAAYDEAANLGKGSYVEAEAKLAKGRMMTALAGRQDEARLLFEQVATARKVEPQKAEETPAPTRELTQEEKVAQENAEKIEKLLDVSYATEAEKALARIKGLPASK